MNSEDMNSYISTVEEHVFELKKIVTCSWLSRTLGLHTNICKQLLYTFIEKNPKKRELTVTYLIIGSASENKPCQMLIVKEADVDGIEKSLNITSKHVYSIQKSLDVPDVNVLYTSQTEENCTFTDGISAIQFSYNERNDKLIAKLKLDSLPTVSKAPIGIAKKVISSSENIKDIINQDQTKEPNPTEDKENPNIKVKSNGVTVPNIKNNSTVKKKTDKVSAAKKPQGIGAFFSKTANNPIKVVASNVTKGHSEQNSENKSETNAVSEQMSPSKENTDPSYIREANSTNNIMDTSKTSPENPKKSENNKVKLVPKKVVPKQSRKKSAKQNEKDSKKRKRIVVFSDSESNNSDEDEEAVREPTPEPESTPIPELVDGDIVCGTPEPAKKRQRKLISRTFTSAEGYLVTEKHYVDGSCSEDDEGAPEKKFKKVSQQSCDSNSAENLKRENMSHKPSTLSPPKKKQSSLISFFKKK